MPAGFGTRTSSISQPRVRKISAGAAKPESCLAGKELHMIIFFLRFLLRYPAVNYTFKVNNRNTSIRCEICSKLTIQTVFMVNFEHISHFVLVFLLFTLST